MPQLAAITVKDGASTPADRIFTPVSTNGTMAQLAERVGVPLGQMKLDVNVRPPVSGNGLYKVMISLKKPTVATVNGVSVVDYVDFASFTMTTSDRATAQNRKDVRVLMANLLSNATIVDVVDNLVPLY